MNPNQNKSHKITLPTIIAYNSTAQAQKLITQHGYPRAKNVRELEVRLAQVIKEFGDEGLREIAKIHPHKDLILQYNAVRMMEGGKGNGYYNNTGLPPEILYVYKESGVLPTLMEVDDWGNTRYRRDGNNNYADGSGVASKIIGAGTIILGVLALGTLLVAFGEKKRSYARSITHN